MIDNAVSMFAGVEGFGLALERQGVSVKASIEIDPQARSVIAKHFPNTTIFNDVREATSEQLRDSGFVPHRGIITAGFPCQDLSIAGKRAGLGGSRSGLFWQIVRLARELEPRCLLLENVPGLLSAVCPCTGNGECVANERARKCGAFVRVVVTVNGKDRTRSEWRDNVPHGVRGGACQFGCFETHGGAMGVVLGALGQLGYGIGYRILDAQYFGVPQRRRRVFIVGYFGNDGSASAEILALAEGLSRDSATSDEARSNAVSALTRGFGAGGADDNAGRAGHLVTHTLTGNGFDASEDGTGRGTPIIAQPLLTKRRDSGDETLVYVKSARAQSDQDDETWVEGAVSPTLNVMDNTGDSRATVVMLDITHDSEVRESDISPTLTQRMGTGGNQVPLAFRHNGAVYEGESESVFPQLAAQHQGGGPAVIDTVRSHPRPGSNSDGLLTIEQVRPRRLTPMECERLQGFPDDWTAGQSDSARYKQMGNAVAVPVAEWIIKRIVRGGDSVESTQRSA